MFFSVGCQVEDEEDEDGKTIKGNRSYYENQGATLMNLTVNDLSGEKRYNTNGELKTPSKKKPLQYLKHNYQYIFTSSKPGAKKVKADGSRINEIQAEAREKLESEVFGIKAKKGDAFKLFQGQIKTSSNISVDENNNDESKTGDINDVVEEDTKINDNLDKDRENFEIGDDVEKINKDMSISKRQYKVVKKNGNKITIKTKTGNPVVVDIKQIRKKKLFDLHSIWDDEEDLFVPLPSSFGLADRKAREFMVFE